MSTTSPRVTAQTELEEAEMELASLPLRRDELLARIYELRRAANYPDKLVEEAIGG